MMSLVAREISTRLSYKVSGGARVASKARTGRKSSARPISHAYTARRAYSTAKVTPWESDDLALLGTYQGVPTPRGQTKTSTGVVGLDVQPEARDVLIELYKRCAAELTKFPEGFAYRVDNEQHLQQRLAILLEETDVIRLEEEIDDGQLESLIAEAETELNHTIPSLLELKPWATPINKWETKRPYIYTDINIL